MTAQNEFRGSPGDTSKHAAMVAEVIQVTPQMAQDWLSKNRRNRHLSSLVVHRYADSMRSGQWIPHGQAIQFDVSGNLVDGQHRLCAVIEAGVPATMLVARNVPSEARDVIDAGRKRTPGDVLAIEGIRNSVTVGAALRLLFHYDRGTLAQYSDARSRPTNRQLIELLAEALGIEDSATVGHRAFRLLPPAVGAFCHYVFARIDRDKADEFFQVLIEGTGLGRGSPILLLRNRLLDNRTAKARLSSIELAALIIKAWSAWKAGSPVKNLRWRRRGENGPEEFPRAV